MEELTDDAKEMLEALKVEETPSKTSSERMWAAVAAGGAGAALLGGIGKGKLLLLGALGITGVVALVLVTGPETPEPTGRGGEVATVSDGVGPSAVNEPEVPPEANEPEPPEVNEPEPKTTADPSPGALDAPLEPAEVDEPEPRPKARSRVEPSADTLEEELSLLGDAKAALGRGDAKSALSILGKHKKQFPRSSFAEEREFLRMTALCDAGKQAEARSAAERFLKKHPSSALSPRVKKLCTDP